MAAQQEQKGQSFVNSELEGLRLIARGKVRDIYEVPERPDALLFIATDRISAFDVVMTNGIPNKGKILNQISLFWFSLLSDPELGGNHLITSEVNEMPESVRRHADQVAGRCMLVKKLEMLPVEAIVRGYIAGSGWKEYTKTGTVCGLVLPAGLLESSELPEPIFTPSTKAEVGIHDENISQEQAERILGRERAEAVKHRAIAIYNKARLYAASKGILIADTKFEFGVDTDGSLVLADEILTPDSSRFWPADRYEAGRGQDSFDKQYVRDYLESINFDKQTPVALPQDVIDRTMAKYVEIFRILTGTDPSL
eukprot:TRINITY_DN628_c0_g2_i1.p1 TRINITY_DN628_c0_g2~~TRINITY_DN628_c0_g2_i1.p1  ORF type:complete len:334 (+),score=129.42 TRINITY_DN628_c0_g2_i1:72-1004(+)